MENIPPKCTVKDSSNSKSFLTKFLKLPVDKEKEIDYVNKKENYFLINESNELYYKNTGNESYIVKMQNGKLIKEKNTNRVDYDKILFLDYINESDLIQNYDGEDFVIQKLKDANNKRKVVGNLEIGKFFLLIDKSGSNQLCYKIDQKYFKIFDPNSTFSSNISEIKNEEIEINEGLVKAYMSSIGNIRKKKEKKKKRETKKFPKIANDIIQFPISDENKDVIREEKTIFSEKSNPEIPKKKKEKEIEENNKENEKQNIKSECDQIIIDLEYWEDSEVLKFRYSAGFNWYGENIWKETNLFSGITRKVRNFFAEKQSNSFIKEEYRKKWEQDRENMLKQYNKVNWIKNELGKKVVSNDLYKSFDQEKSWIDQLPKAWQKQKVADFVKNEIKINVTYENALTVWEDEDKINKLAEAIKTSEVEKVDNETIKLNIEEKKPSLTDNLKNLGKNIQNKFWGLFRKKSK